MRLNITIPDDCVPALREAAKHSQRSLGNYIVAVITGIQQPIAVKIWPAGTAAFLRMAEENGKALLNGTLDE